MKMYKTHLIKPPLGTDDVRFPNGNTGNIIETVLYADTKAAYYTTAFAPTLKGATVLESCHNIWQFIKTQIQYDLDPEGLQLIKSPGQLWAANKKGKGNYRGGDCKSFAVFTASCLKNLGIKYGYRFASYEAGSHTPTHVYVYVPNRNGEIIIDAVWDGPFNTQKSFTYKKDCAIEAQAAVGKVNTTVKAKGFLQY